MIFTRPFGNLTIIEGNTGSITCTVEGGTPSTLDWYRNGIKLTEGNGNIGLSHTTVNSVVLTLRNVTSLNSGGHMCVATTAAGTNISASVIVNVLSKSKI